MLQKGLTTTVKDSREKTGCNAILSTDAISLTNDIVRRVHKAQLHKSSNASSDIVDNYNIKIDK